MPKILVTGATGYIAGHIIERLLLQGHLVVGTVRSLKNTKKLEHLKEMKNAENLSFVEADLTNEKGWKEAVKDCDYVLHTASPFPLKSPKNRQELIGPAVKGTELALSHALQEESVKKIVLTSSCVAIYPGQSVENFDESVWGIPEKAGAYEASKILAEKRAWDLIKEHQQKGGKKQLSVINPGLVMGPFHSKNNSFTSAEMVQQILTGKFPGLAPIEIPLVDVRNVAEAHIKAMDNKEADGKRFVLCQTSIKFEEMAKVISDEFKQYGYKPTSNKLCPWLISFLALFMADVKQLKPLVNKKLNFDHSQSEKILGIKYLDVKEGILAACYHLIKFGQVKDKLPQGYQPSYNVDTIQK